jgi:hypothetical protein
MNKLRSALLCLPIIAMAVLLSACLTSGPKKSLNALAQALNKKDSVAFLAQLDLKVFAANQIKNMTREDQALNSLNSLGQMLGLGGLDDLLGSVLNMETRLQKQYTRGVSTGELAAQCRAVQTPDCPWTPEALENAVVTELGDTAAIAKVTTATGMTSWLALQKKGDRWLVVAQAILENTARAYAGDRSVPPVSGSPVSPEPENKPDGKSGNGVVKI